MKILFSLALLLMSFCVDAQDMQKYLSDTRAMISSGNYKEALNREIWFHNNAEKYNKSMGAVRLSFALSYWKDLGDKYPPALTALKKIRDDKTKLVKADGGPSDLFHDVAAINRTLKQDEKTIDLFKAIDKTHPAMAQSNWHYVKQALFDAKDYSTIKKYIRTPYYEYTAVKGAYDSSVSFYTRMGAGQAAYKRLTEKNFIDKTVQLIKYSLAVYETRMAKDIQKQADLIITDGRIEKALKKSA